jgi:hypothetical protein
MAATRKAQVKWDERFIVRAYKLAEQGHTDAHIADELGVHEENFSRWVSQHPGLQLALHEARNPPKNPDALREYVYGVLPEHLQELWDRIDFCQDAPSGYERTKALLANRGDNALQHLFLYGLTKTHFDAAKVCSMLGISPAKMKRWVQDDPEFHELMEYVAEAKGYFFEGHLVGKVAEGDIQAILHVNRTYNRDKYGDSVKVDKTVRGKVTHDHKHLHVHVGLGELNLSRECANELMEKYLARKREKENAGNTPRALSGPGRQAGPIEVVDQKPSAHGQAIEGRGEGVVLPSRVDHVGADGGAAGADSNTGRPECGLKELSSDP